MGLNLWFGEFGADVDPEERYVSATAQKPEGVEWPEDAPLSSSLSRANSCHPSYTAWAKFTREVGLGAVVGEGSELIDSHPGAAELTGDHLRTFEGALECYSASVGATVEEAEARILASEARRAACATSLERLGWRYEDVPPSDWNLLRLRWLVFWTRWCLENCKYPTFANS